jgi:hypothetical protein
MALPFTLADRTRKSSGTPVITLGDASRPAQPGDLASASHDPRALRILAKSIYRELRQGGLLEEDVMGLAGELLSLVAGEVKDRRRPTDPLPGPHASHLKA